MASKGEEVSPAVQEGINSIGRLVYDVLMYTLPKCGLPTTRLPTTDVRENVYRRPNLVKIAGVSALRIALIMRDKWKLMFISRRKATGLDDKEIPIFMMNIVRCCSLSRKSTMQTIVEVMLALSNEITLFFYAENIVFNASAVIGSVGYLVINLIGQHKNYLEAVEQLFDKFDNLEEYTKWITDFIMEFAIPYGSKEDVSELFFLEVKKQHFREIRRAKEKVKAEPEEPSIKKLKEHLGFLPHDLYSTIMADEPVSLPENLMLASGSTLPGDRDSPEPQELPRSSKKGSAEKKKSRRRLPTGSGKTSKESGPLVSASGPISPDTLSKSRASSESGGTGGKKSRGRRPTGTKETSEESKPLLSASGPISPDKLQKSHASSESGGTEGKKSSKKRSRKASKQTAQGQQSSMDSPEVRLEDELRQMSLGTDGASQASRGAIPKKKEPEK